MKNAIIILVLLLFGSCTSDSKLQDATKHTVKAFKNQRDSVTHFCNLKMDSLGLRAAYDTCKFWLYCYNVADTIHFRKNRSPVDSVALFSQLNLDCAGINIPNDTIEFVFHIILEDSVTINWGRTVIPYGVLYKLSDNRPIGFVFSGPAHHIWSTDPRNRLCNPLQPATIKYIQTNYSRFNPWFVERLKERGIVK